MRGPWPARTHSRFVEEPRQKPSTLKSGPGRPTLEGGALRAKVGEGTSPLKRYLKGESVPKEGSRQGASEGLLGLLESGTDKKTITEPMVIKHLCSGF